MRMKLFTLCESRRGQLEAEGWDSCCPGSEVLLLPLLLVLRNEAPRPFFFEVTRGRLEARGQETGTSVSLKHPTQEFQKPGTPEWHGGHGNGTEASEMDGMAQRN